MPQAQDTHGAVFKRGSAIMLARIVDANGQPVTQADVASIRYSVLELDSRDPDAATPVTGHENAALPTNQCLFDTLQTGGLWTTDAEGYNFRHAIDVAAADAFPKAGSLYQVRYEVAPTAGQKIVFRFQLRCL